MVTWLCNSNRVGAFVNIKEIINTPDATDKSNKKTLLDSAIATKNVTIIMTLVKAGARLTKEKTQIITRIIRTSKRTIRKKTKHKQKENIRFFTRIKRFFHQALYNKLKWAIQQKDMRMISWLCDKKRVGYFMRIDTRMPDPESPKEKTLLDYARDTNDPAIIKII